MASVRTTFDIMPHTRPAAFKAMWAAAKAMWPSMVGRLGYTGSDGNNHHFQEQGNPVPFVLTLDLKGV